MAELIDKSYTTGRTSTKVRHVAWRVALMVHYIQELPHRSVLYKSCTV